MKNNPHFLVVDLFCGAGGTTTGFEQTNGKAKVIACVNHDKKAIKSHWLNHPEVVHFEEDIRTLDLTDLIKIVNQKRKQFPNAKLILWASLECTNFSKAKGGLPRNADSRSLADEMQRYIKAINPDIMQIENVVEFRAWGPLDANGKPISKQNGTEWLRWCKEICALGYVVEWRELNAANFGAYTSRNRLFGMFAKDADLITFPAQTHFKKPSSGNLFSAPLKWKPVREVLDLQDEGNSIFGRKKDLSDKTLERIYAGLLKYIAGGEKNYLTKIYAVASNSHGCTDINRPATTITTRDAHALVKPVFMMQANSGTPKSKVFSSEKPARTITATGGNQYACFLTKYHGTGANICSPNEPASTLSTKDRLAKIQPIWIDKQYTGKENHQSIESPAGTIMNNDKHSLIHTHFIDRNFTNGGQHQSIESPAGSILSVPKLNLVQCSRFLLNTNFNNIGSDLESPSPTITASRHHQYLLNPQFSNKGNSLDKPCFTLIARMDKRPPYLITTESGEMAIQIFESDSDIVVKIKMFMAAYGIVDIKMRMLKILELLKIQGFPDGYILEGTQTDQKKFIGNSVHPLVVVEWTTALVNNLLKIAA